MSLQETIYRTLTTTRDKEVKDALRILKAELQREKDKDVSDARVAKIIQGLIKAEQERIDRIDTHKKGGIEDKTKGIKYIHILSEILPAKVGEEEIRDWVIENIDFSEFKNPMQAMRFILDYFGKEKVDSQTAKTVIEDLT